MDRSHLINVTTERLLRALDEVLSGECTEAGLRGAVEPLLEAFCQALLITPLVHGECTLAKGRAGAIFHWFAVVFVRPGALKQGLDQPTRQSLAKAKELLKETARQVEEELDRCLAQLWGLALEDLAEIQRSLRELRDEENQGEVICCARSE